MLKQIDLAKETLRVKGKSQKIHKRIIPFIPSLEIGKTKQGKQGNYYS